MAKNKKKKFVKSNLEEIKEDESRTTNFTNLGGFDGPNSFASSTVKQSDLEEDDILDEENCTVGKDEMSKLIGKSEPVELEKGEAVKWIEDKAVTFWIWLNITLKRYTFGDCFKAAMGIIIIYIMFSMYFDNKRYMVDPIKSEEKQPFKMEIKGEGAEISKLRKSFTYYREKLSKDELESTAWNRFRKAKYKSGGSLIKFGTSDCCNFVFEFLRGFGYPSSFTKSVKGARNFAHKLNRAGLLEFRKKRLRYKDVRIGDLIFFKPINGTAHIGIVTGYLGNKILYMDFNGAIGLQCQNFVYANSNRIWDVCEVSWSFWSQDYIEEIEKKRIQKLQKGR